MDKRYISLFLAGEKYDYIYYKKDRTVCTQDFPDVPVVRVSLGCGHSIDHDTIRNIIEDRFRSVDTLADLF